MKPSGWPPGRPTELVGVPGSPRRTKRGDSPASTTSNSSGRSWNHWMEPFSPYTRSRCEFRWPMATWLAHKLPRAPLAKRSSTLTLSSMARPGTMALTSAATSATFSPVTNSTSWKECEPMSPSAPAPACLGSVRQLACFCPVFSMRRGQPALRIFRLHHAQLADEPVGDELLGVPDHRVAGVVERDA